MQRKNMWPEVEIAKKDKRHEIILVGPSINERIEKEGLDNSLFNVTSLNYLNIHGTSLSEMPDSISNLNGLQTLVLHSNKLTSLNINIQKLDKLKVLDLSRNNLEEIPSIFDTLENIVTINISNNKLKNFPELTRNSKLSVLDLSQNELTEFPNVCSANLTNLSEVKINGNYITSIPDNISVLSSLKVLDISHNKIKTIPGNLADCAKLKEVNLKENPIVDRRLFKLIGQCRTKQVMDYVKLHCPKVILNTINDKSDKKGKESCNNSKKIVNDHEFKYKINISPIKCNNEVVSKGENFYRKYIVCCVVEGISFDEMNFKKFIQLQNRLHEGICDKRNAGTIATHDLKKMGNGNLTYEKKNLDGLKLKPLNKKIEMTGKELYEELRDEAEKIRKEKKKSKYSGIHKYLYLIPEDCSCSCLTNAVGDVISLPPITNSEISKIELSTTDIFIEVTSNVTLTICRKILDTLIREMVLLFEKDLTVMQVKIVDEQGVLKYVYPSKNDLLFEEEKIIQVVRP